MTVAVAILAHQKLGRVADLARFLIESGVYVVIHVDAKVSGPRFNEFKTSLSQHPEILWVDRMACDWGDFSLVQATLNMSRAALNKWADASHVQLISGDSLPIRPISDLNSFLDEHADTDYIESVLVNGNNWVKDGLGIERFTLHFPFSWKSQRKLFDIWVDLQRKLKIHRRIPEGMRLHIGSQWWCLTRKTLLAILDDQNRISNDRYFAKCWIPDESYFSTLARKHSAKIESRSLVFSKFDYQGKPIIFYDDHLEALSGLDEYFTRKVWYGAAKLYEAFIGSTTKAASKTRESVGEPLEIGATIEHRQIGQKNLHVQNQRLGDAAKTVAPYHILTGVQQLFPSINNWISTRSDVTTLGQVFAADKVQFDTEGGDGPGGLSNIASIRDHAPEAFLGNLVRNTVSGGLVFHHEVYDHQNIVEFFLRDPNANMYYIRHSWVIELMNRKISNNDFLQIEAARMAQRERAFISKIRALDSVCEVNVWTVGEVITNPNPLLSKISENLAVIRNAGPIVLPNLADISKLVVFGQKLRDSGVAMDIKALEASSVRRHGSSRVQVIK